MIEFRFHGRGGQALASWAEVIALAALKQGKYAQTYQSFGLDRPGAPNTAVTRVDDQFIAQRAGMGTAPDVVVLLDPSLAGKVNLAAGLRPGGLVLAPQGCLPAETPGLAEVPADPREAVAARAMMVGAAGAASGEIELPALQEAASELGFGKLADAIAAGFASIVRR